MITATVVKLDAGYKSEQDKNTQLGLKIGDSFIVESIDMGQSSTTIYLENLGGFNSVFFEFFENEIPLDIYSDKRFNPYL